MLDARAYPVLRAVTAPPLPIAEMVCGQEVAAAAELLPRVFNLCREAQGLAARCAFGLPVPVGAAEAVRREILRAHVAKLALQWPALLGCPPLALPADWQDNPQALRAALFGGAARMPQTPAGFARFVLAQDGVAPIFTALSDLFDPGEGCRRALPCPTPARVFGTALMDNSIAARHAGHPLMRDIARRWGRGPLWCAVAIGLDLEAVLSGKVPAVWSRPGCAVVPAARGFYAVRAQVTAGRVTHFERITPTDHLLRPGGVMAQCLASLPSDAEALGPILLGLLDPCLPVTLSPAEMAHA